MYVMGHGIMKNNDEAIYWACRAAQSGEFMPQIPYKVSIENIIA